MNCKLCSKPMRPGNDITLIQKGTVVESEETEKEELVANEAKPSGYHTLCFNKAFMSPKHALAQLKEISRKRAGTAK